MIALGMYFVGMHGLYSMAILGFIVFVTLYWFIQGLTDFRNPLHGTLLVGFLTLLYTLLLPALSKAR